MQAAKQVIVLDQESVTNGATATGVVDTLGFDRLMVDLITSTSNAVSNNPSVLKLAEGDTTSAFTNVSGATGDAGSADFDIPDAVTDQSQFWSEYLPPP